MRHRVSHFFRASKTQISHEVTDRREETYSISLKAPDRGTVKTQKSPNVYSRTLRPLVVVFYLIHNI